MSAASPRLRRELTRFTKFAVVGVVGAVVDFGVFNLLRVGTGLASPFAQAISFAAAVTSNFIWNRFWTYPDSRSKAISSQAIQFAIVNVIGLAIRTPIFILTEPPLEVLAARFLEAFGSTLPEAVATVLPQQASALGSNLALAVAVVIVLFWNFGINRLWTYSDAP